jgi:glycosyltransferase involved in cell wall biosynthesis
MTYAVLVDVAGGPMGGAARFRDELYLYLTRTGRKDVKVIGSERRVDPTWLLHREALGSVRVRRVSLNNVGFVAPGGERWTLLGNALHFLNDDEVSHLDPSLRTIARHQAPIVRLAARRSDVLIAPCSAMADRVTRVLPSVKKRLVVRMHPVSTGPIPSRPHGKLILCPVIFSPYKHMAERLTEWVEAVDKHIDPEVRLVVTASPSEVPDSLAGSPRIEFVGQLQHAKLVELWADSRAIYFPTGLESFGFPMAEARVSGWPVIARDTAQNREIAGQAHCAFTVGDENSLRQATELAMTANVSPDPAPFDPDAYFDWMLGNRPD